MASLENVSTDDPRAVLAKVKKEAHIAADDSKRVVDEVSKDGSAAEPTDDRWDVCVGSSVRMTISEAAPNPPAVGTGTSGLARQGSACVAIARSRAAAILHRRRRSVSGLTTSQVGAVAVSVSHT